MNEDASENEAAGATACLRTFDVHPYRQRYDLRHIREVLGLSSLQATKDLCESDPVSLGGIVARVISVLKSLGKVVGRAPFAAGNLTRGRARMD